MSPGERLKLFINLCYNGNISACASDMGVHQSHLSVYVNEKRNVGNKMMGYFESVGGNDLWLMKGVGSMFNNSERGRALSEKYGSVAETIKNGSNVEVLPGQNTGQIKAVNDKQGVYRIDTSNEAKAFRVQPIGKSQILLTFFQEPAGAALSKPVLDGGEEELDLAELLRIDGDVFIVEVTGDSMTGAGIYPGDLLIVCRNAEAKDRDIVLVYIEGEMLVKRLRTQGEKRWLVSDNSEYLPIEINGGQEISIFGVVENSIRRHKKPNGNGG